MTPLIGGLLKKLGFQAITLQELFDRYATYKSISVEPSTLEGYRSRFLYHIPPHIRRKKARDVTRRELIDILIRMEQSGMHNLPKRLFYDIRAMLQYAVLIEEIEMNVFAGIFAKDIFRNQTSEHFPEITDHAQLAQLLRDIDSYTGTYRIKVATQILPYLFVRSHNIRSMEWVELDLDSAIWTIPAPKMKMKAPFVLPLPRQAVALLRDMQMGFHHPDGA